jgi:hypothetical protein
VSGDHGYAARITRSERNSHQLERNFQEAGRAKPRVAVTVDLLSTGFDAPGEKVIVFMRPIRSAILYKQMKGRGTRLREDTDKRFFTIIDYSGASALEDAEFDGHPANTQKLAPAKKKPVPPATTPQPKPVAQGVSLYIAASERFVCLADGRKIPFDEYREQSKEIIRKISPSDLQTLLNLWADRQTRQDVRECGLRGLGVSMLKNCRQFYRIYPQIRQSEIGDLPDAPQRRAIRQSLIGDSDRPGTCKPRKRISATPTPLSPESLRAFSWTHFIEFIRLDAPWKRAFYETECLKGNWSVRQLQRQIGSLLFERTGLSVNKKKLIQRAHGQAQESPSHAAELIRDPYVLEFTGLAARPESTESELESALLDHLQARSQVTVFEETITESRLPEEYRWSSWSKILGRR